MKTGARYVLPKHLRDKLKEPMGDMLRPDELRGTKKRIICVGDNASRSVLESGVEPKIVVYDGRSMRENIEIPGIIKNFKADEIRIKNPAGHLTDETFSSLKEALSSKSSTKIIVDGEEDLITLAAIHLSPVDSLVIYGQPGEGLVVVDVDNKIKKKVKGILGEMRHED